MNDWIPQSATIYNYLQAERDHVRLLHYVLHAFTVIFEVIYIRCIQ